VTYLPDPELAALQHVLPRADLSDLAGTRELERRFLGAAKPYEAARHLVFTDAVAPGNAGNPDVRVRIVRPAEPAGPLPGLLYLRSSGFVLGTLASVENAARRLVEQVDVAVIAVDYRTAPEHPYPAALEDSYAALQWAAGNAAVRCGINPDRLAVLGDSAGGGLAIALSMITRERPGPGLTAQFLDAPTVDDRCDTPSMKEFTDTPMWRGPDTPIIWQHYLGAIRRGSDDVPIHAAPARASVNDLAGLPPTWIATYQLDPTRDESLALADRLIHAGVPTELHHYAGAFHLTHAFPGTSIGTRILTDKYAAIRRILAS
jgi:acetyl esterase